MFCHINFVTKNILTKENTQFSSYIKYQSHSIFFKKLQYKNEDNKEIEH